jgi:hypothetical protein
MDLAQIIVSISELSYFLSDDLKHSFLLLQELYPGGKERLSREIQAWLIATVGAKNRLPKKGEGDANEFNHELFCALVNRVRFYIEKPRVPGGRKSVEVIVEGLVENQFSGMLPVSLVGYLGASIAFSKARGEVLARLKGLRGYDKDTFLAAWSNPLGKDADPALQAAGPDVDWQSWTPPRHPPIVLPRPDQAQDWAASQDGVVFGSGRPGGVEGDGGENGDGEDEGMGASGVGLREVGVFWVLPRMSTSRISWTEADVLTGGFSFPSRVYALYYIDPPFGVNAGGAAWDKEPWSKEQVHTCLYIIVF